MYCAVWVIRIHRPAVIGIGNDTTVSMAAVESGRRTACASANASRKSTPGITTGNATIDTMTSGKHAMPAAQYNTGRSITSPINATMPGAANANAIASEGSASLDVPRTDRRARRPDRPDPRRQRNRPPRQHNVRPARLTETLNRSAPVLPCIARELRRAEEFAGAGFEGARHRGCRLRG